MKHTYHTKVIQDLWSVSALVSKQLDNSLGALHGINLTEYMVLTRLQAAPNQVMRRVDLAEAVGRTASSITKMLSPMEKVGLVEKEVNARDARVSLVKLTDAGQTIARDAEHTVTQKSEQLLNRLDHTQIKNLAALLKTLLT